MLSYLNPLRYIPSSSSIPIPPISPAAAAKMISENTTKIQPPSDPYSLTIDSETDLPNTTIPIRRPRLGFGVYGSPPEQTKKSCLLALKYGYKQIDTAQYYGNEAEVGEAVRESGLPRKAVFVTTKILKPEGSVEASLERCRRSVTEMGLDHVDLFLIHTPSSGLEGRKEMWHALEKLMHEGKTKAIGVSNYGPKHIEEIKEYSNIMPASNQIELHPWCQQREIVEYCHSHGIVIEAYSPLVRGKVFSNPTLQAIANKNDATPAQVLVRWSLQKGYVPLPKSDHEERIKENANVFFFNLAKEEMDLLDEMDQGQKGAIVPQSTDCP